MITMSPGVSRVSRVYNTRLCHHGRQAGWCGVLTVWAGDRDWSAAPVCSPARPTTTTTLRAPLGSLGQSEGRQDTPQDSQEGRGSSTKKNLELSSWSLQTNSFIKLAFSSAPVYIGVDLIYDVQVANINIWKGPFMMKYYRVLTEEN